MLTLMMNGYDMKQKIKEIEIMIEIKKHVLNMNSEMWSIFDEHGEYDYNDEMLTQLEELSISMSDCADRNFENVHDVYDDC